MTDAGLRFLQCAFAPPDFNVDPGQGIPDAFNGKTFTDKNVLSKALTGTAGKDDYYVFAPTPGVAFWYTQTPTGVAPGAAASWAPTYFPGCFGSGNIFGDETTGFNARANNVDRFRYASMCAGIYPTSSLNNTSGSIQVWKTPLSLADETYSQTIPTSTPTTINAVAKVVSGLDGADTVPRDNFSQGLINGTYVVSTNNQEDFRFQDILEGVVQLPYSSYTGSGMHGKMVGPVLGLGDMDAIVIKISSPTGSTNAFVLKTWACIEYRPTADSVFDRFAGLSPGLDEVALQAYRHASTQLPLAVVAAHNADFWDIVTKVLGYGAQAASLVPGPIGVIGSATTMLMDGIRGLTLTHRKPGR